MKRCEKFGYVMVRRDVCFDTRKESVTVSWSSIGEISIEDAKAFAADLNSAIKRSEEWSVDVARSNAQRERSAAWLAEHADHVLEITAGVKEAVEPTGIDAAQPELWKGIHWRWYFQKYVGCIPDGYR